MSQTGGYAPVFCGGVQPFLPSRCLVCQIIENHDKSAFSLTRYGVTLYSEKVKALNVVPVEKKKSINKETNSSETSTMKKFPLSSECEDIHKEVTVKKKKSKKLTNIILGKRLEFMRKAHFGLKKTYRMKFHCKK